MFQTPVVVQGLGLLTTVARELTEILRLILIGVPGKISFIVLLSLGLFHFDFPFDGATMSFDVFGEVVTSGESLVAYVANEPLFPGVSSQMALKFIGSREPLATEKPVADERSLARVPSQVSLQVGGFVINLSTARNVATVLDSLTKIIGCRTQLFDLLAVRTVAVGSSSGIPSVGRSSAVELELLRWKRSVNGVVDEIRAEIRFGFAEDSLWIVFVTLHGQCCCRCR